MKWLDFIVSKRGQWEHPLKPTAVPTKNGRITMQGVPYPVFAMDETGYGGMIYPGGNYQFRGKMVYEIPMAYGGDISIPDLSRPNWLDKAQKGKQVKYYDDLKEFNKAKEIYNDSLSDYLKNKYIYESYSGAGGVFKETYDEMAELAEKNKRDYGWAKSDYPQKPKEKPVYKEKPKEYIPTKTPKLEREHVELIIPQSDRTLMPYNNTLQVLRGIQKEDRSDENLYPTRVVPAPTFKSGGWLEKYQDGSQVAPNLPRYNLEIGPTIKNAELLKEERLREAVRNSQSLNLPSGAIQPTLGPIDYMLLGSARPVVELMQGKPSKNDVELAEIRKALKRGTENIIQSTKPKPRPNSTVDAPYLKRYPELDKQEQMYLMDELSGRWGNEANYWRGYNKRMHGLDYDRPIPKFFDPTIPVKKQGGWLDNY